MTRRIVRGTPTTRKVGHLPAAVLCPELSLERRRRMVLAGWYLSTAGGLCVRCDRPYGVGDWLHADDGHGPRGYCCARIAVPLPPVIGHR